jgi:hypothetical protein
VFEGVFLLREVFDMLESIRKREGLCEVVFDQTEDKKFYEILFSFKGTDYFLNTAYENVYTPDYRLVSGYMHSHKEGDINCQYNLYIRKELYDRSVSVYDNLINGFNVLMDLGAMPPKVYKKVDDRKDYFNISEDSSKTKTVVESHSGRSFEFHIPNNGYRLLNDYFVTDSFKITLVDEDSHKYKLALKEGVNPKIPDSTLVLKCMDYVRKSDGGWMCNERATLIVHDLQHEGKLVYEPSHIYEYRREEEMKKYVYNKTKENVRKAGYDIFDDEEDEKLGLGKSDLERIFAERGI